MTTVRSLSKQIEELERTATSRLGEDRAGMTAAECAQMWHLAVKLQEQVQALLDEPVGEVERLKKIAPELGRIADDLEHIATVLSIPHSDRCLTDQVEDIREKQRRVIELRAKLTKEPQGAEE